jgi:hypothetical protein
MELTICCFQLDRYLVIIDDIWNLRELEIFTLSLPRNNLGSRIVITTRIEDVAKKWREVSYGYNALIHKMLPEWDSEEGWVYKIGEENIANLMIAMKDDLVLEGFECEHPIVQMCGGTPLAVRCMLSAVTKEREKQAQQGLHGKACDAQDKIEKHIMKNGIQNTPGFEPLVESLQLCVDDLPHHMLKTCLMYCSMYPDGHIFEHDNLVRRWNSEGLVYTEENAHGYVKELYNRFFVNYQRRLQPMMRIFLRWKSGQDNFFTCSSQITNSYNNSCRIRRLIYDLPCRDDASNQAGPLSALDWSHVRSLVIYEGIGRVPFEKLEGVRLLDLCGATDLVGHHWNNICDLVRLRHLLGLCDTPPEIVRLQSLETLEMSGMVSIERLPVFIGELQLLKTLDVRANEIKELPREIGALQQLRTLRIAGTRITNLPREIEALQQLETLDMQCSSVRELPKEIGSLQQLKTLDMSLTKITELPREIGRLQQLKTLDMSRTRIMELPMEVGSLQQLKTLDISNTSIKVLPKEIGKLQQLEHLVMNYTSVSKIPREIVGLNKLKSVELDEVHVSVALPLEVCALVGLPEYIQQTFKKSHKLSELAMEMLSFEKSASAIATVGLVVGAKQMLIPPWIKEHFNGLQVLDICICKLEKGGLKILREMPYLRKLTLRFDIVPREPIVISSVGFAMLEYLIVDSRVPRLTFQEGAMPMLGGLVFKFKFYAGPPNKDPVGVNHLKSLTNIYFECNKDWYPGVDSLCIRPTIDIVRKEAQKLGKMVKLHLCGCSESINGV